MRPAYFLSTWISPGSVLFLVSRGQFTLGQLSCSPRYAPPPSPKPSASTVQMHVGIALLSMRCQPRVFASATPDTAPQTLPVAGPPPQRDEASSPLGRRIAAIPASFRTPPLTHNAWLSDRTAFHSHRRVPASGCQSVTRGYQSVTRGCQSVTHGCQSSTARAPLVVSSGTATLRTGFTSSWRNQDTSSRPRAPPLVAERGNKCGIPSCSRRPACWARRPGARTPHT